MGDVSIQRSDEQRVTTVRAIPAPAARGTAAGTCFAVGRGERFFCEPQRRHSLMRGVAVLSPAWGSAPHYAPFVRVHCTMPDAFMAPAWRALSRPPRNRASVGMRRML